MSAASFIPGFKLILASQSPRRRELLTQAGFEFEVRPSHIAEVRLDCEAGRDYVGRLAAEKAAATPASEGEGILAADTTVSVTIDGQETILEKPHSAADAARMLKLLSGRPHDVFTGICFLWQGNSWTHVEHTVVEFATLTDAEIESYIASGEPFDKAGAYGIQGRASCFIPAIRGCYFNVVGLPVRQVYRVLSEAGVLSRA